MEALGLFRPITFQWNDRNVFFFVATALSLADNLSGRTHQAGGFARKIDRREWSVLYARRSCTKRTGHRGVPAELFF